MLSLPVFPAGAGAEDTAPAGTVSMFDRYRHLTFVEETGSDRLSGIGDRRCDLAAAAEAPKGSRSGFHLNDRRY